MKKSTSARFNQAAMVALARSSGKSLHGAVALRADGKLVYAHNGGQKTPTPAHHCEARLCRKLTPGSTIWLVRVTREGRWADSTPCRHCMGRLQAAQVDVVYFTTGPTTYAKLRFVRSRGRRNRLAGCTLQGSTNAMKALYTPSSWLESASPGTLFGLEREPGLPRPASTVKTGPLTHV
jgi:tRNA(Arg) A34 adenosine deaminase TadA